MMRQVTNPDNGNALYLAYARNFPVLSNCYLCFAPEGRPVTAVGLYPAKPEHLGFVCARCFERVQLKPTGRLVEVYGRMCPDYRLALPEAEA